MPKMSDTMEQGVIATWLKQEGDTVKAGDILAEIETDKATMELEAYEDGTLLYIGVKEKEIAPVNHMIAIIGKVGEDITGLLEETHKQLEQKEKITEKLTIPTSEKANTTAPKIFASPLAKKLAYDKGYDLATIQGTGEGGRIIQRDIEGINATTQLNKALPSTTLPPVVDEEVYEDIPVSQMRSSIAKRLAESKFSAPHFYLTVSVDMDQIVAARPSINEYAPVKVSLNDIVIKATAMAIRQHRAINVAWLGNTIRYNKHIHMGIAVAVEEGLLVPVVRFVDNKSLAHIAEEMKTLMQKANNKQLKPKELAESTFTLSNLGMLGIESFTAILNPPAACILAIGEIKQVPVVKHNSVVPGHMMKATLSCDHRAVDGAVGAAFLKTFKALLENPIKMLIN